MNRTRKTTAASATAIVLATVVMGVFIGCGSNGDTAPDSQQADQRQAENATAESRTDEQSADSDQTGDTDQPAEPAAPSPTDSARTSQQRQRENSNQQSEAQQSALVVDPPNVDFGTAAPNTSHETTFSLRNVADRPITLLAARPTCKCTTLLDVNGEVVAPGESFDLPATLETPSRPGRKSAEIRIVYRIGDVQHVDRARLSADVRLAVVAEPPFVDALRGNTSGVLTVRSPDGEPFRILSSNGKEPRFVDHDPRNDEPRSMYNIRWEISDWPRRAPCRGVRLWWIIETDHPDCPILPCRIRHECTGSQWDPYRRQRRWIFDELIVNAQSLQAGEPAEITIDLLNRRQVAITGVRSRHDQATAELIGQTHDANKDVTTLRVRFTPDAEYRGMLYAPVEVQSNRGHKAVPVVARIEN